MQIQSTLNTPRKAFSPPAPTQQEAKESWLPTKDEVKFGASIIGGGLALGAGGMYLGFEVGMHLGSKIIESNMAGQPAPIALLTLFASLPAAIATTAVGSAVGGAIGATAGSALGLAAYDHFNKSA